jgi:enterochelin esterase-like enzyme
MQPPGLNYSRAMVLPIRRRTVLATGGLGLLAIAGAGVGVRLVDSGRLPGRSALNEVLGRCDVTQPAAPGAAGAVVDGLFVSAARRTRVGYRLVYPPGFAPGSRLPVCLVLHGWGADERRAIDAGRYDRYLAALVAAGEPAFVLAACAGGPGYWHSHVDDDPPGMLFDEFLPLLAGHGLATGTGARVAVLGWSMGGYGALLCAIRRPDLFAACVASGPAIWRSYAEAHRVNAGAFGSAAEWAANDVFALGDRLGAVQTRIDCGESDSFAPAVRALRDRLPDPGVVHLARGCHNDAFWRHVAPLQLRLIAHALAAPV